jgi:hypothetical protein
LKGCRAAGDAKPRKDDMIGSGFFRHDGSTKISIPFSVEKKSEAKGKKRKTTNLFFSIERKN